MAASSANCGLAKPTLYRDHLLRLDPDSRRRRFCGAVADEFSAPACRRRARPGCHHSRLFRRRRLARRRRIARRLDPLSREAEAAFSIEKPVAKPRRRLGAARAHAAAARATAASSALHMHCLADNQRMQQLARKFEADLHFDFGSVVGDVDPPRSTALSLMREIDRGRARRRQRDHRRAIAFTEVRLTTGSRHGYEKLLSAGPPPSRRRQLQAAATFDSG